MKTKKFLAVMLASTMLLAACGGKTDGDKGGKEGGANKGGAILKTNNSSNPGSLDPALATGTHESWILSHTFEGLMTNGKDGKLIPAVAEAEPTVSDDGLKYTFKIRKDAKWSNGDPVSAKDFEFSWLRALDPNTKSQYAHQFYYIKGAEAYNTEKDEAKREALKKDIAIKATDDHTLEVTLERPTPFFKELTAFYTYYPVNKKAMEANKDWFKAQKPGDFVSNGPFKVEKWEQKVKVEIRKNENYYDKDKVKLAGIDFDIIEDENTAFQKYDNGEYDILVTPPAAVTSKKLQNKDKDLIIGEMAGTYYFDLNSKVKPFGNKKVRNALSMALNRKQITEKVAQGGQHPAEGMVPYGIVDEKGGEYVKTKDNLIKENVEEAKKLLEEGLKEEGMTVADLNGKVLLYNTSEAHKKIAQAVQDMWKNALGFNVALENVEFQVKLDREKAGDFMISRVGWVGDFNDPMTMLEIFMKNNPHNNSKYASPEYNANIEKSIVETDLAKRMDLLRTAEKILIDDMPAIPVYHYTQPYLVKENLKGVYKPLLNYPKMTYAELTK